MAVRRTSPLILKKTLHARIALRCAGVAFLLGFAMVGASCNRDGENQLVSGTYGLGVYKVKGDRQTIYPNQITRTNLTVQVVGTDGYTPVGGAVVNFSETSSAGVTILTPTVETDSNGYASTPIRVGGVMGNSVTIQAQVDGTQSSATFNLKIATTQPGTRFALDTTHGGTETAGVPFRFIAKVVDDTGAPDATVSGPMVVQWTFTTQSSWAGVAPSFQQGGTGPALALPTTTVCNFTSGICMSDPFTLTDSRQLTTVWFGDGPGGYFDVFAQTLTVVPNVAAGVAFVNKAGGPNAGAQVIAPTATWTLSADNPLQTVYGALIDAGGNFIRDTNTTATWTLSSETNYAGAPKPVLTPSFSNLLDHVVFTPSITGKAKLDLSFGSFTVSRNLLIEPGLPADLVLDTQNHGNETAGASFTVSVGIVDAHGNSTIGSGGTSAADGPYQLTESLGPTLNGKATGSVVDMPFTTSAGCSGFSFGTVNGGKFVCGFKTIPVNVVNGAILETLSPGRITKAGPPNTPVLSVWMKNLAGTVSLFKTMPLTVSLGAPTHLDLYSSLTDHSTYLCTPGYMIDFCNYSSVNNSPPGAVPDLQMKAGQAAASFYPALEDDGGNFIAYVQLDSWTATGPWIPDWTSANVPDGLGGTVTKMTLTPIHSGKAKLTLVKGAISTQLDGETWNGDLDHWGASVNDGTNFLGSISVKKKHWLEIYPYDAYGNWIYRDTRYVSFSSGNSQYRNFHISYSGATSSPAGTAPIIPPTQTYTLQIFPPVPGGVSGAFAKLDNSGAGYLLPNAADTVTISVSDVSATPAPTSNYSFAPVLLAGAPVSIALRDAGNGGGTNVSTSAPGTGIFTMDTDTPKKLYLSMVDSEGNFINNSAAVWNYSAITAGASASVDTSQPGYITITGDKPINGIVSVTVPATPVNFTASTHVYINPGVLHHIDLATTNGGTEAAGTQFQLMATLRDAKNNAKTDISGMQSVNISLQNQPATAYGLLPLGPANTTSSINFTAGVMTTQNFTLYNSAQSPQFILTLLGKSSTLNMILTSGAFDHVRVHSASGTTVLAGAPITLNLAATDIYGNTLTGAPGSAVVNFGFASTLNGQAINSSTLVSPVSGGAGNNPTVSGNLTGGAANVVVQATQAGVMQFSAALQGYVNNTPPTGGKDTVIIQPQPTIASIEFSPPLPATYTASATNYIPGFQIRLLDIYNNVITTNSSTSINLTRTQGTAVLYGTLLGVVSSGVTPVFSNLQYAKAETLTITATETTSSKTASATITVNPGTATKTVVVLDGDQTLQPGNIATPIAGTPTNKTACTTMTATVYAVDDGYNVATAYNMGAVGLNLSETIGGSTIVTPGTLVTSGAGWSRFSFTNRLAASGHQLIPTSGLGANQGSSSYTVIPGAATQVLLLMPGESLTPGAANAIAARTGTVGTQVAGTAFSVVADLTDACFNLVNDSTHHVGLSYFGGASFHPFTTGGFIYGVNDVSWPGSLLLAAGQATFTMNYYKTGTGVTLTPSSVDLAGVTYNSGNAFTVNNATATQLAYGAYPAAGTYTGGANLGIKVNILDSYSNLVTTTADATATVQLVRTGGNAMIAAGSGFNPQGSISKAAVDGVADFSIGSYANVEDTSTLNQINASATLNAVAKNLSGPNTFDITFGSLDHFKMTGLAPSPIAGAQHSVTTTAQDLYNNTVTNFTGTAAFSSSDAQAVLPANYTYVAGESGVHLFTNGVTLKTAGLQSVTVTSSLKTGSQSATVAANTPFQLAMAGASSVVAGACSTAITVTTQDTYSNASNVASTDTVTLSGATGTADLYSDSGCTTLLAGAQNARTLTINTGTNSATFYLKGTTKGTLSLGASDSLLLNVASRTVTVNYNPNSLALTKTAGDLQTGTAGSALATAIQIHLQDNYGNAANGVTVTNSGGQGTVSGAASTDASGNWSGTWTLGTATPPTTHTQIINCSGQAGCGVGTQVTFSATANPGAPTQLAFSTQPVGNQTQGNAFVTQPVVAEKDANGNVSTSAVDTIALAAFQDAACTNPVGGTLGGTSSVAATSGVASFSGLNYTYATGGSGASATIYLKATSGAMTKCSSAFTIYDTLTLTAASGSVGTGTADAFTIKGGVPTLTALVLTNSSGSTTTSSTYATNCAPCTYNYTSGQTGGGSNDTIKVTDAAGNIATATVSVTGAKLAWDGANHNYGTVATDTAYTVNLSNPGTATSGAVTFSIANCKKNSTAGAYCAMWNADGAGSTCVNGGTTLAAAASCVDQVYFLSGSGGLGAGTYDADLTVSSSGGGSLTIHLTGTK